MCRLFIQMELNSLFQQEKMGLLVTERLFIVHCPTWHPGENYRFFWGLCTAVPASVQRDQANVRGKSLGG